MKIFKRKCSAEQSECRAPSHPSGIGSRAKSRGQSSLIDLVIGFFIFALILASIMGTINKNTKDFTRNSEIDEINHDSFFSVKELTETKGFPENWEILDENSVEKIGLIERRNTISEDKVVAFSNMTYSKTKELLKIEGYDYYFVLNGVDNITAGINPVGQTKYSIITKRIVNYKGSEAEIEFRLYELWE